MAKHMVDFYSRAGGHVQPDNGTEIPLAANVDEWTWKLFVGLNGKEVERICGSEELKFDKIYCKQVGLLLAYFVDLRPEELNTVKAQRETYRLEFVGDAQWRAHVVDGVTWLVQYNKSLPWFIPITMHYHNSMAVKPRFATDSEMIQCGRLVSTNDSLYHYNKLFKKLVPLLIDLTAKLVPAVAGEDDLNVWDRFNEGNLMWWYRPCYELFVLPFCMLGNSMVLGFKHSDLYDEAGAPINRDKIFVPAGAVVYHFAGEVRPVDLSAEDNHATNLLKDYKVKDTKLAHNAAMVTTLGVHDEHRPAVGNAAFMANCTCGGDNRNAEYFKFCEMALQAKKPDIITNCDLIYKHLMLRAKVDIRGSDIVSWHDRMRAFHAVFELCAPTDLIYFPVEFMYNAATPKDKDSFVGARCICMSACMVELTRRRNVYIFNKAQFTREQRTDEWVERVARSKDLSETSKKLVRAFQDQFKQQSDDH